MKGVDTFLGKTMDTSIRHDGLLVPANAIGKHLRPYSEPALFHTDGMGPYHLTKAGSVAKIRLKERFFVLASKHQIVGAGYEHYQIGLLNYGNNRFVSSGRVVFPELTEDSLSDFDCILYEFTDSVLDGKLPAAGWFNISTQMSNDTTPKPKMVLAIGYPSYRNNIDYEASAYGAAPNLIIGKETPPGVDGRLAFEPEPAIDFEPEGMSGGPVFGVRTDGDQLELFFAGILTNASKQKFNFLSFIRAKKLLDHVLLE